jgi:hypothetical protein
MNRSFYLTVDVFLLLQNENGQQNIRIFVVVTKISIFIEL